jgi:hypothetical protein
MDIRLSDDVITENSIRATASINEHLYIIASPERQQGRAGGERSGGEST